MSEIKKIDMEWIHVNDTKPPIQTGCLFIVPVFNRNGEFMQWDFIAGYITEDNELLYTSDDDSGWQPEDVEYWMLLPEPPLK